MTTNTNKTNTFSLDDLDISKDSESGYEFELLLEGITSSNCTGSGIFLTVQGDHSQKLQEEERIANYKIREKDDFRAKRGGKNSTKPPEESEDEGVTAIARRVIAWRGITEECTRDNVKTLIRKRPEIVEQIVTEARNITNFTHRK